ncbi:hypothetical protein GA707_04650 [Nostocoides sp. F2B08]|uniref:hypothetical protein n=1 Tax=Nostocoides sp. F2B08 TaxID=2653936 RepID=UPI001263AAA1|nr:hypothetical protein [Tetrasphaera sp. F2B08]KAB7745241.1 hypothetical protein GA707_04650 [Tetrasphaera sp. F2B08]
MTKGLDMTDIATATSRSATAPDRARAQRLLALSGGIGAGVAGLWLLLSSPVPATVTGDGVTQGLIDGATSLQAMSLLAVFASAALIPAAARLGSAIGGAAGRVVTAAGTATAVLLTAYISCFAAGALTATLLVQNPGAGVGEASLVMANVAELARYGTSLALTGAVVAARGRLAPAIWVPAAALTATLVFPLTSWMTAIVVPAWLGIAAATLRTGAPSPSDG